MNRPAFREGHGMFLFECEATFEAEPDAVWKLWTDVTRWPEWDVSKEIARLDGPFEVGSVGWAKQRGNLGGTFVIAEIENGRRWLTECPVPLGRVTFDHELEPLDGGRIRLFAPRMKRDIAESLAALERMLSG